MTAGKLLAPEKDGDDEGANNFIIRLAKKYLRTTDHYDGDKLFTIENGRRVLTPMLLVMIAIGGTDILFALDSIPAIYGLTQNVFIVFTATAFSLMGLRQLYFLIDGLLDRLIYLKYGLSLILGFIGVKLILHALHENSLPFINGGEPVPVYEIEIGLSLSVILGILIVTVLASVFSPAGKMLTAVRQIDRLAYGYIHTEYHGDEAEREANYQRMLDAEASLTQFNQDKLLEQMEESGALRAVEKAHRMHAEATRS